MIWLDLWSAEIEILKNTASPAERMEAMEHFESQIEQHPVLKDIDATNRFLGAVRTFVETGEDIGLDKAFHDFAIDCSFAIAAIMSANDANQYLSERGKAAGSGPREGSQRISNEELIDAVIACFKVGEFNLDAPTFKQKDALLNYIMKIQATKEKAYKAESQSAVDRAIKRLRANKEYRAEFDAKYQ